MDIDELLPHMPAGYLLPTNLLEQTPFRHIVVNWNPHGHIPPGVFDTPHYDFHFYMIGESLAAASKRRQPKRCVCPLKARLPYRSPAKTSHA